jgi:translation initiation factor 2 beta subunit (eIF-2beta)/eIF-5
MQLDRYEIRRNMEADNGRVFLCRVVIATEKHYDKEHIISFVIRELNKTGKDARRDNLVVQVVWPNSRESRIIGNYTIV